MNMISDIKYSLVSLARSIPYSLTVVATLGVTLAALITMFNLNYQIFLAPLPYPEEDKIFVSQGQEFNQGKLESSGHASLASVLASYKYMKEKQYETSLVGYSNDVVRSFADTPDVDVTFVSPEFFSIFDISMQQGRGLSAEEGLDSHQAVAVISDSFWRERFSSSNTVLGQSLLIGEVSYKIIGVISKESIEAKLAAPGRSTEIYLPWDYNPSHVSYGRSWGAFFSWNYIVTKIGASQEQGVQQQLSDDINRQFQDGVSGKKGFVNYSIAVQLVKLRAAIVGDTSQQILLMLLGSLFLLLISVTNVANVVSARLANQQKNLAIRAAIGAQRYHLFWGIFIELIILIAIACTLALILSLYGLDIFKSLMFESLPMVADLSLDVASLIFAVITLFVLAIALSSLVYRQINFKRLNTQLQSSGKGTGLQVSSKVRRILIITQISITTFLLSGCILALFNSISMLSQDPGFSIENRYNIRMNEVKPQIRTREQYQEYKKARIAEIQAISDELAHNNKIENISVGLTVPVNYAGGSYQTSMISETADYKVKKSFESIPSDHNHLSILNTELVKGRYYTKREVLDKSAVMIINETGAKNLNNTGDVLGKRFFWENGEGKVRYQVVGVVKDYSVPGISEPPRMWAPYGYEREASLLIKVRNNQKISASEINSHFAKVSSRYRVQKVDSLQGNMERFLFKQKMALWMSILLSIFSISLTAIGIYGVISYGIAMRRNELGVRMAIGARLPIIAKQIFSENLIDVLIGVGIASIASLIALNFVDSTFFSVSIKELVIPVVFILCMTGLVISLSVFNILRVPIITILRNQ